MNAIRFFLILIGTMVITGCSSNKNEAGDDNSGSSKEVAVPGKSGKYKFDNRRAQQLSGKFNTSNKRSAITEREINEITSLLVDYFNDEIDFLYQNRNLEDNDKFEEAMWQFHESHRYSDDLFILLEQLDDEGRLPKDCLVDLYRLDEDCERVRAAFGKTHSKMEEMVNEEVKMVETEAETDCPTEMPTERANTEMANNAE